MGTAYSLLAVWLVPALSYEAAQGFLTRKKRPALASYQNRPYRRLDRRSAIHRPIAERLSLEVCQDTDNTRVASHDNRIEPVAMLGRRNISSDPAGRRVFHANERATCWCLVAPAPEFDIAVLFVLQP